MKLVKNLGTKLINNKWVRFGIFWCDFCKQEVERRLINGKIAKSCGCVQYKENIGNFKDGRTGTRLYKIWDGIKQRSLNLKNKDYPNYGGRGITICQEWVNDYTKFRNWALNNGYQEGLTIDRINNNGNYEPTNCQWLTSKENTRKRSSTKVSLEISNEIRSLYNSGYYTQKELGIKYSVDQQLISMIINNKIWV